LSDLLVSSYQYFDGNALEQFDDPDETWDIFKAIIADIKEQLPAQSKTKAKKPKAKVTKKRR
jgi:hypothetical protein